MIFWETLIQLMKKVVVMILQNKNQATLEWLVMMMEAFQQILELNVLVIVTVEKSVKLEK